MATLFGTIKPRKKISSVSTPKGLHRALHIIFESIDSNLWLVGGTALSGFYAEHRRSDDLDLFALDPFTHRSALLSVKNLKKEGASFSDERRTPSYYHAYVNFLNHSFTIDIVLDEHLSTIGHAHRVGNIWVADLDTLFTMKIACLVSRCSEKDFFDLDWLFSKLDQKIGIDELVKRGALLDGGLTVETLLISLKGATLREDACHFLLPSSKLSVKDAFKKITHLRDKLVSELIDYEKKTAYSKEAMAIKETVTELKRLKK